MRAINRSVVLNLIKNGPIARAEVARQSGLSPATVSGITAGLIADGMVIEKDVGDSRAGRPPILLALNPSGAYVIGIKLAADRVIGALTDLEANILQKATVDLEDGTPEQAVASICALGDELLARAAASRRKLLGIGVGLAGVLDFAGGIVRTSPTFGWQDLPLGQMLSEKFDVPVYLDNDVNTLTLAEYWFGVGQGFDNCLTITIGRGVGMGIVMNGQFYRGAGGGAGEFGHMVIDPAGPLCSCGNRGCLETLICDGALLDQAKQAHAEGRMAEPAATMDDLLRLARGDDPAAREIFGRAGAVLGQYVGAMINVLNPGRVIIGGEGVRAGDLLFHSMHDAIARSVMPTLLQDVDVRIEPWGDDAWARGAASLVLGEIFSSPVYRQQSKP